MSEQQDDAAMGQSDNSDATEGPGIGTPNSMDTGVSGVTRTSAAPGMTGGYGSEVTPENQEGITGGYGTGGETPQEQGES